jgi:vacuolar protein sorting-associated protein 13A/C
MREGMKGLIKGTAKGITGLIIKPVTGILDASAKTAESVTNTATIFDDKPNDQRIRVPRIFYETTRYFKKYKD